MPKTQANTVTNRILHIITSTIKIVLSILYILVATYIFFKIKDVYASYIFLAIIVCIGYGVLYLVMRKNLLFPAFAWFKKDKSYSLYQKMVSTFIVCSTIFGAFIFFQPLKSTTVLHKDDRFQKAFDYANKYHGAGLIIYRNGETLFEGYNKGVLPQDNFALRSGTKSFSSIALATLIQDGKISSFDQKISDIITEWQTDDTKKDITMRQLLSLSSGIYGPEDKEVMTYKEAVANYPLKHPIGTNFDYSTPAFQIFGEVVSRLTNKPYEVYLQERVFNDIGFRYDSWVRTKDGKVAVSTGCHTNAQNWLKFGIFLLNKGKVGDKEVIRADLMNELVQSKNLNPYYGLSFWLGGEGKPALTSSQFAEGADEYISDYASSIKTSQRFYAAEGNGNQRLYIIPEKNVVIVRQSTLIGIIGEFGWSNNVFFNLVMSEL
jgi:CubicO group peptidase (beta-lactamase class C family)